MAPRTGSTRLRRDCSDMHIAALGCGGFSDERNAQMTFNETSY